MRLLYGTKASFARMTGDCQRQRITCPTTCTRGVVRARTLWGSIATARGPMHDILLWLLSSPFISILSYCLSTILSSCLLGSFNDALSVVALVTAEHGHETRVSARPRPASLFHPTVRALDCDVSLRYCTATHQHGCFYV